VAGLWCAKSVNANCLEQSGDIRPHCQVDQLLEAAISNPAPAAHRETLSGSWAAAMSLYHSKTSVNVHCDQNRKKKTGIDPTLAFLRGGSAHLAPMLEARILATLSASRLLGRVHASLVFVNFLLFSNSVRRVAQMGLGKPRPAGCSSPPTTGKRSYADVYWVHDVGKFVPCPSLAGLDRVRPRELTVYPSKNCLLWPISCAPPSSCGLPRNCIFLCAMIAQ